mmetsp:Transcript_11615/g.17772  ORF Transcript_11615/g.17772 Transcript_11615/m.17772 type:complete len:365 (+) Transcript_11615:75-1169(+)
MDVFDAADLLAIEEDSLSSSSSSCSGSVANGSEKASSRPLHEDKEDPSPSPCPHESEVDDGNRLLGKAIEQSLLDENAEESYDDDSSDDGFLESMLTLEKESTQEDNLQQTVEKKEKSDSGTKVVCSHQSLNESLDARTSFDANVDVSILLGDSIGQWMTRSHQALKEKSKMKQSLDAEERPTWKTYDGAISIQNREGKLNDGVHTSALRLSVGKKRKRQNVAGSEVAEATLEQLQPGDTQNDGKQQCFGMAAIAPDGERANIGTMVDCLARYDPEKGAYVLEIVDLDVSGLTTTREEDGRDKDTENDESAELLAEKANSIIADPRSRAKQAATQLRRLKQGRGIRSERKRPTSTPHSNTGNKP